MVRYNEKKKHMRYYIENYLENNLFAFKLEINEFLAMFTEDKIKFESTKRKLSYI